MSSSNLKFRRPTVDDIETLYDLIIESTGGKTKLQTSSLRECLFKSNRRELSEVEKQDPSVELNLDLLRTDTPAASAVLAEINNKIVGYALYHYYYTPWVGHSMYVDDIYILAEHRNEGVAKALFHKLNEIIKDLGLKKMLLSTHRAQPKQKDYLVKEGWVVYRGPETDWSMYIIKLARKGI